MIDPTEIAGLQGQLQRLRAIRGDGWEDEARKHIAAWFTKRLPVLPKPTVTVRLFRELHSGRAFFRATISMQPVFMDVTIDEQG